MQAEPLRFGWVVWRKWGKVLHAEAIPEIPQHLAMSIFKQNQTTVIKLNYCSKLFLTIKSFKNKLYYLHRALVDRMAKHEYQPS